MGRDEFWSSTPREIGDAFEAAHRRADDEYNRDTIQAWQIVHIWARTKTKGRMPTLRSLLRRPPATRPLAHRAQLAVLQLLSEQYGIPLRRRLLKDIH
jgi:hypothetical protein